MFRPASRIILRSAQSSLAPARTAAGRRFLTTEAPHLRSRSWKSSAARWGLAIAGIYYYTTSPLFAEKPTNNLLNPNLDALEDIESPTIESLTSKRQNREQKQASVLKSAAETASARSITSESIPVSTDPGNSTTSSSPAELEEEAQGQGAFNEETGEINWDCPCLGGMAHGPCGPEFREAFSCFVFSKEEPKGMDCIEKFKGMQDCFQKYPEIYKGELEDDEELEAGLEGEKAELQKEIAERRDAVEKKQADGKVEAVPAKRLLEEPGPAPTKKSTVKKTSTKGKAPDEAKVQAPISSEPHPGMSEEHEAAKEEGSSPSRPGSPSAPPAKFDEDLELMPKDWHDAREAKPSATEK